MNNWRSALISASSTFRHAIEVIDNTALQAGLIVDEQSRLIGMLTDGTIRRAILNGVPMDENIRKVMFTNFKYASTKESNESILSTMKKERIRHIPVLDESGVICDLKTLIDLIETERKENIVVLMAGGLGTRLRPLTENCPKPLLRVGNKPILETIIQNYVDQGFYKFYISVNYCADMIKDYFGNGERWDIDINYLEENEPLGTAGALSLLPEKPTLPFFIMNGDLLTKIDFSKLLDFHNEHQSCATMCVRQFEYQIPYGVVNFEGVDLLGLEEKPIQTYFVNAGIYALSPESLDLVSKNKFLDMTTLFEKLVEKKSRTNVFPVREYWMDIGQMKDYQQANGDYCLYFDTFQEKTKN